MNTVNKTQLIGAVIAAVVVIGLAAAIIPNVGMIAAGTVIAGGLLAMGVFEGKKRAY